MEGAIVDVLEEGAWRRGVIVKKFRNGWRRVQVGNREEPVKVCGTDRLRRADLALEDGVLLPVLALVSWKVRQQFCAVDRGQIGWSSHKTSACANKQGTSDRVSEDYFCPKARQRLRAFRACTLRRIVSCCAHDALRYCAKDTSHRNSAAAQCCFPRC